MSMRGLQLLVGRAVISEEFRKGILNGARADYIRDIDLEPEERAGILAIRAINLADFAAQVEEIARRREQPAVRSGARHV